MLTDAALKSLKPRDKIYKVADRDGMYVIVQPTGSITFRLDYRLNGRRETLTLGRYGGAGLSLARAREKLIDAMPGDERLQYEGYLRREDTNAAILKQSESGASIREISRVTGHSRGMVRKILRGQRSEKADAESLQRVPSARTIARLMTVGRDTLSKAETSLVAAIEGGVPSLVEARDLVAKFHTMIRKKAVAELDPWVEQAKASLITSFANGVARDRAAVSAAISSSWSNGQTEGQITKLKLVKRQMYGRAKIDLLQARLVDVD